MSLPQISRLDTARSSAQLDTGIQRANSTASSSGGSDVSRAVDSGAADGSGLQLRNEFLTLMVAQLQNQDPTNPLDGAQYVTQLAQFSMVEGIEGLKVMQNQSIVMMETQQILMSTQLVGKQVMVPSDSITLADQSSMNGRVELAGAADDVEINILDENGNVVQTKKVSSTEQGSVEYNFDDLPPGKYTVEVKATMEGKNVPTKNYISGEVERIVLDSSGSTMLQVSGIGQINLFEAIEFGKPNDNSNKPEISPRAKSI